MFVVLTIEEVRIGRENVLCAWLPVARTAPSAAEAVRDDSGSSFGFCSPCDLVLVSLSSAAGPSITFPELIEGWESRRSCTVPELPSGLS